MSTVTLDNLANQQLDLSYTLDEILTILPKLREPDLIRFIQPHFEGMALDALPKPSLVSLCFDVLQAWEDATPSKRDFYIQITAAMCRASFEAFVRLFWEEVPGAQQLLWNWHMGEVFCKELQIVAEEIFQGNQRPHDLVCNVSPNTSKSSIWSILFPCWMWTRMPKARIITASHTDLLVTTLAAKARDTMKGLLYRTLFPEIVFTESQDSKGYYRNTHGGERFTCTVGGKTPMGQHAHAIICLPFESAITTNMGMIPIGYIVENKLSVQILGYDHINNKPVWKSIEKYEISNGRPLCRVGFTDGSFIEATGDHPIYVNGKGYVFAEELIHGDEVLRIPTTGTKVVKTIEIRVRIPNKVYNIRVADTHNYFADGILLHNCDDPLDPQKVLSEAERKTAADFMTKVIPTRRMRGATGDICVTMLVMQRLGIGDPTDVVLETARQPGAAPLRHLCLPAELTGDISPPEMRKYYEGFNTDAVQDARGLMDPIRLNKKVLSEQLSTLREWAYAGQYLQKPYAPGGGMFKDKFFSNRELAAPYNCRRIRYWDRAASIAESACATAGVLMAYDGEKVYVEDVVYGRWEPDERNGIMRATALRDRSRYGKYEPVIYVEAEGGSSGRDAWLGIVRTLIGFHVKEDHVKGSKDTRAEPWATQLSAGNVWLIDNGESKGIGKAGWDINGYIEEHRNFRPTPGQKLGRWKDRIDSSSGAFNLLVGLKRVNSPLRTYSLIHSKKNQQRKIIVCGKDDLEMLNLEDNIPTLLVFLQDPGPAPIISNIADNNIQPDLIIGNKVTPTQQSPPACFALSKPLVNTLGALELRFADLNPAEYQATWNEPISPWGKKPEEIQYTRDIAKKFWSFVLRQYSNPWKVLILVDQGGGDGRALSIAMGAADAMRIPRNTIFLPSAGDDEICDEDDAPNDYIFDTTKAARNMVVS